MKPLTRYWPSLLGLLLSTAAWAQTPAPVTNDLFVASLSGHVIRLNGLSGTTVYDLPVDSSAIDLVKGPDGALYVSTSGPSVIRVDLETGEFLGTFASGGGLSNAVGVAFGPDGNLYVGDRGTNSVILRYDGATGSFIDTFVASGSGGLSGIEALLFGPDGNLYVTEFTGHRVLRYDGVTGAFLGVFATDPRLDWARSMIFEPDGDLYVAGNVSGNVVRFDGRTGAFKSVFATGIAGANGLAFGPDGNLYVAAQVANKIMRFDGTSGAFLSDFVSVNSPIGLMFDLRAITTAAGSATSGFCGDGGPATSACLNFPIGVAVDATSNLLVADFGNNRIRTVDATTGIITTVAGSATAGFCGDGGTASSACLNGPSGLAVDGDGNLLIADSNNNRIRWVEAATGIITTVAGSATAGFCGDDGQATDACLNAPLGVALDAGGNPLIVDRMNHRIRRVDAATGIITTVAGSGMSSFCGDGFPATSACLNQPSGVAVDADGNLFIADDGNSRIRRVDAATGIITTIAGSATAGFCGDGGLATNACLNHPTGIALDADGNLLIADRANHRVRSVNVVTRRITSVAGKGTFGFCGDGGPAIRACLAGPSAVAVDPLSGSILIGDQVNHRVRGS